LVTAKNWRVKQKSEVL